MLTHMQTLVLQLIANGADGDKDVARRIGLSHLTVNDHLRAAFRRLGVHNRAHAVAEAMRRGIIK